MTLDLVTSQRLIEPTRWEMEQYRSAPKHERDGWHDVLDRAHAYRWDDSVLRVVESEARRAEYQRQWFMPAPAACSAATRPNVFRALFQKDIGGVAGVSDSWFDASYYAVDGVSGKVSDWVDYIDPTHTLRQATSALQAAAPSADSAMANALSATLAGGARYSSTRTPASWGHFHNGSGCEVITGFVPTSGDVQAFLATGGQGGPGLISYVIASAAYAAAQKEAGVGIFNASAGALTLNAGTYTDYRYASPTWAHSQRGLAGTTGPESAPPSASVPQGTLVLGANYQGGQNVINFRWRFAYITRRVLSAAHRTIVQKWIQRETGVAP